MDEGEKSADELKTYTLFPGWKRKLFSYFVEWRWFISYLAGWREYTNMFVYLWSYKKATIFYLHECQGLILGKRRGLT